MAPAFSAILLLIFNPFFLMEGAAAERAFVHSVAELRAFPIKRGSTISAVTSGYYSPGDGGGACYVFRANSTLGENGGTVIIPDGSPPSGRWVASSASNRVSARLFGARGDGLADDAPRLQAALDWLATQPGARTLLLPEGIWRIISDCAQAAWPAFPFGGKSSALSLAQSGVLKIEGAGPQKTAIVTERPRTILEGYAPGPPALDLWVEGVTFRYTGGWNTASNCVAIGATGHVRALHVSNCAFYDFTTSIYGAGSMEQEEILRSGFFSTYGRAGLAQADPTFNFPCVALLQIARKTRIEGCQANGLMDGIFAKLPATVNPAQKCALDGFLETNDSGVEITVRRNELLNFNIEAIHCTPVAAPPRQCQTLIENNHIVMCPVISSFYTRFDGGIVTHRQSTIRGNFIENGGGAVYAAINVLSPAARPVRPLIEKNRLMNSYLGISLDHCSGAIIRNNVIYGHESYPAGDIQAGLSAARGGIRLKECKNCLVEKNDIDQRADTAWWSVRETVLPRREDARKADSRVYVSDATAFRVGAWVQLRKLKPDGALHQAPIQTVGQDYIELNRDWASAVGGLGGGDFIRRIAPGDDIVEFPPAGPNPIDALSGIAVAIMNTSDCMFLDNSIHRYSVGFYLGGTTGEKRSFIEGNAFHAVPIPILDARLSNGQNVSGKKPTQNSFRSQ